MNRRYVEAVGRRKTAVARVRIVPAAKATFLVNDKTLDKYFPLGELRQAAAAPLDVLETKPILQIGVKVSGGGISSQAGAVAHGLARALTKAKPENRPVLKKHLFLRRDSRMKERRKFGLKKARKAPQWSKR
ncbi:MAG: 30S ribosomal protein S9 [Candidatus Vogelbacteria bacterium]|nr:30S ribosomal protein S9 [Candidatus Vogelbacteria bacterium]